MALQLCIYLSRALQEKLAQRQGFDPKKPGEKEAHAKPVYRTLDRAFEMLEYEKKYLQEKFTVDDWRYLFSVLDSSVRLSEVADIIKSEIPFSVLGVPESSVLRTIDIDLVFAWSILDVAERWHAHPDADNTADGLKKLGILCREEV